jgi:glycosyltransferase involved in cell wall biosynthesis
MKIFMFVSNFLPHLGGLEFYVHDISQSLNKNWADDVHIICFDDAEKLCEEHTHYKIHRVKRLAVIGGVFSIPSPLSLIRVLKRLLRDSGKPQQIWTHTRFFVSSLVGVIVAKCLGIRVLHVEHGSTHVVHKNSAIHFFAWAWDQSLGRIVLRSADHVVVVAPQATSFVKKLGAQRVSFIPAGVSERFLKGPRDRYVIPTVPVFLFVGRLLPGKGVENLLRALSDPRLESAQLDIIGDGPERTYLEELTKDLGLSSRVRFHGAVAREELHRWYKSASLFVNPSFSEGGPLTVLESLALGVPVVSTPVGCVTQYFEASEGHGLLTQGFTVEDLTSALKRAIHTFAIQDGVRCSQKLGSTFSWQQVAGKIRTLGEPLK